MARKTAAKPTDFWHALPRPFFAIAPMANVTDCAFRRMFAKYGKPDVMWTEFVSADGLVSAAGQKKLLIDLKFSPRERPIVAQLFTASPDAMKKAAALIARLGFDGLDINMGCPDRAVVKQGGGAAMMQDHVAALAVLDAAREGVWGAKGTKSISRNRVIPVSVKTRIGYNKIDLDWIKLLLEQKLPALTVHLRTKKEMSDVPAHWELMPEIVKMRDEIQHDMKSCERTVIIGNGDAFTLEDAASKAGMYGCDGVMIGRGIFGKPWFFAGTEKTPAERLKILVEHSKLFEKEFCGRKRLKSFDVMRKHFKAYVSGWDGAKELRARLMETENAREVAKIISKYAKITAL
jgi:tRNA-dihydrouridine synthase